MGNEILQNIANVRQESQPLPKLVAEQIRQLIIEQHLEIGEKIPNEFELAERLNVGRGTVREAIKLLVARNVLEIRRGRGTFIANNTGLIDDPFGFAYMDDEERLTRELFALRLQMEPWIAGLAAEQATDDNIAELRICQTKIEELLEDGQNHWLEDQQFHVCIAGCTQNRVLPLLIPVITYSVHLFGKKNQRDLSKETIETHARIVHAIAAHDPQTAHTAMLDHLMLNCQTVPALKDFSM